MTTDNVQRSAEELVDQGVAYADMTEEELSSVIELRASWKARDIAHSETQQARHEAMQAIVESANKAAEESKQVLDTLVSIAMDSYKASVKEVEDEQEKQAAEA